MDRVTVHGASLPVGTVPHRVRAHHRAQHNHTPVPITMPVPLMNEITLHAHSQDDLDRQVSIARNQTLKQLEASHGRDLVWSYGDRITPDADWDYDYHQTIQVEAGEEG